jgi:hypothetical protein
MYIMPATHETKARNKNLFPRRSLLSLRIAKNITLKKMGLAVTT